jgi:hypothetical protein
MFQLYRMLIIVILVYNERVAIVSGRTKKSNIEEVTNIVCMDFRSFRNSYLLSGGHDANVIARYSDIEYRLRAYEDYPWTKDYPEPLKQNRCL